MWRGDARLSVTGIGDDSVSPYRVVSHGGAMKVKSSTRAGDRPEFDDGSHAIADR